MADKETQVVVIGGGPGGYAAAFMAADAGMQVTLVDPGENPGGVCLYRGCIPSKALLHAAKVIFDSREAEMIGLSFSGLKIDHNRLRKWKDDVVAKLTGGLGQLAKQKKIAYIRGEAFFEDNRTLRITTDDGQKSSLSFAHAVIATGSHPVRLPGTDIESEHLLDSTSALDLKTIPKTLLVVGGGYIGLELGTVYAALGTKVEVVEMTEDLLPGGDKDLVRVLKRRISETFEAIHLQTTVKGMQEEKNGIQVTLQGPEGEPRKQLFEKVLVAVGRRPNAGNIGLENTKVKTNQRGFIEVDEQRRTAEKHIFAIGDVAGEPMLAHKATHEGRTAAEVIAGRNVMFQPAAIPAVVFTDPEIAWAGLSEAEAKEIGIAFKVTRFPWGASARAATLGRNEGLTKLIIDTDTERLLGIGIVGPGAGEMIAEGVLALEMGANATDIGLTIHPHPTLTETIMEAADIFHGSATHYHAPKRKK
ncbi:MAG: dihydrolipoamide dehydrogenase [Desulfatitalea sp. BRH_c12]|nr:MAG: dihydrolipoamide dehydrogenase [Desulfatitalea sp. BRH_c12]